MINSAACTILIVDDELLNRKVLETLLAPEGYVTWSVASGADALDWVRTQTPDLILLDAMMPDMDGYEVARRLKGEPATSNIPIIMVTALVNRGARLTGLEAGAEEFLTKPVDRAELWLRVRNLLRLKSYGDFMRNHSVLLEAQVRERTAELQRFRTAMDSTSDVVTLVDPVSMKFTEVNAAAARLSGYSREELLQMNPAHIIDISTGELEADYVALTRGTVATHSQEAWVTRKDGHRVPVEVNRQALRNGDGWTIVSVLRDITERLESDEKLQQLAYYDTLTGLPNRRLFQDQLQHSLQHADATGMQLVLMYLDIDNFKDVNDSLGHAIGDELLHQVGKRLLEAMYVRDNVGRLGGDEFAVSLVTPRDLQVAVTVARKIHEAFREPFMLEGHSVSTTASIGITVYPDDAQDASTLMRYADLAMYSAKQTGRNTWRFYTAEMNQRVRDKLELEEALRGALERDEFVLHYQPKVNLHDGRWTGVEALLRWNRPGHGLVRPDQFIPALESTGLILAVGAWVLETACAQLGNWARAGLPLLPIAVNVSALQLMRRPGDPKAEAFDPAASKALERAELWLAAEAALRRHDVVPGTLEIEITESTVMADASHNVEVLQDLKGLGIHLSIDDFGTGYSSLAYLRRFPLDSLKIDGSFIRDVTTNGEDASITLAIIEMAHRLNLLVIAECVETPEQMSFLKKIGCDQVQGFLTARPMPLHELDALRLATGDTLPLEEVMEGAMTENPEATV